MNRPETTLFMLPSVDGKISTGDTDTLDFDADLPKIKGVKEGLWQYYAIEKRTDLHSLNTGKVMAKIGVNTRKNEPKKIRASFVIIDNKPHLNRNGILYLSKWLNKLYLVTTNKNHPAFKSKLRNVEIIYYNKLDLKNLFMKLKSKYDIRKLTIQSGGTMNAAFFRERLIDHISIVLAPVIIGGKDTPTLVDGESLHSKKDLKYVRALRLKKCKVLENSYLHLYYDVII